MKHDKIIEFSLDGEDDYFYIALVLESDIEEVEIALTAQGYSIWGIDHKAEGKAEIICVCI